MSDTTARPPCHYCEKPIFGVVYERMTGWYKRRGSVGGLNGLRMRRPVQIGGRNVVACSTCVALLEQGGNPRTQQTIPGLGA